MTGPSEGRWRERHPRAARVLLRVGFGVGLWLGLRLAFPRSMVPALIGLTLWLATMPRLRRFALGHWIIAAVLLLALWLPLAQWVRAEVEPRLLGWVPWTGPGLDVIPTPVRDRALGALGLGLVIWAVTRPGLWRWAARSGRR